MKTGLCAVVVAGIFSAAAARAQTQGEYASPDVVAPADAQPSPSPVVPRVSRPVLFAPASVATAIKLTPERKLEFRFIKEQAAASRFELDASRLALAKGTSPSVRLFSAELISHNNTLSLELLHLLHAHGMAAPMLDNGQRKMLTRLGKLSGGKFDKAYMEVMAVMQRDELRDFEKASVAVHDLQIKSWVDKTLPTLQNRQALLDRALPRTVSTSRQAAPQRASAVQPVAARLSGSSTP